MPDFYRTIVASAAREVKVKGSRFIAEVWPVTSEDDCAERLAVIKKREYDATHHCWAYRLGVEGNVFRHNDDGEPGGTAGLPIYRQIEGRELTDVMVVVIRYYGGKKLGTGGLARAYSDAAAACLEACKVVKKTVRKPLCIRFDYADTSPAMHAINGFDAVIVASRYSDKTELELAVRASQVDDLKSQLIDNMAGRVAISAGCMD